MIIFFFHRYNDLDHIAPLVYKMAQNNSNQTAILSLNPNYDIENDLRLNFLKHNNVMVDYIYSFYCNKLVRFYFKNFCVYKSRKKCFKSFQRQAKKTIKINLNTFKIVLNMVIDFIYLFSWKYMHNIIFNKFLLNFYYNENWAKSLFLKVKPSLLIFDHSVRPGLYISESLFLTAKKYNIPIMSVPHGVLLFDGDHPYIKRSYETAKTNIEAGCNHIIVCYKEWKQNYINRGFNKDNIHVLGSARYSNEWREILKKIIPIDKRLNFDSKKIKVVYLERQADRHNEYKSIVKDTLEKINKLEFVDLLVQPCTRSKKIHFDISKDIKITHNIDSINLCKWADVIICLSSFVIEVLLTNKIYINAKFLHGQTLLTEKYNVGLNVNSYMELEENLTKIYQGVNFVPYERENIDRFLLDIVNGGVENRDILGDYKKFMSHFAKFV